MNISITHKNFLVFSTNGAGKMTFPAKKKI